MSLTDAATTSAVNDDMQGNLSLAQVEVQVNKYIKENTVMIFSKSYCPFCTKVKDLFNEIDVPYFALELDAVPDGSTMQQVLYNKTGQRTVPSVFVNTKHLGGCDKTLEAHRDGTLMQLIEQGIKAYDFDLVVIGGGSGGLAASKEAANLGKRVAVLDFIKPSPRGTTWGLGGTCVNVGCIPKKLMHQAALLGESLHDAKSFGWEVPEKVTHNWDAMIEAVQNHIKSLNWNYRVALRTKKVEYINAYGEFLEQHKIRAVDKRGKERIVTADTFILAMGGRPKYPDIPGAIEHGITSDDLFSLSYCPGKTVIIGASYVALECAGFLHNLGLEVTVVVRSILLRGFDQDMAVRIGKHMEDKGIKFLYKTQPTKVECVGSGRPGKLKVHCKSNDGEDTVHDCNTVLFAVGRDACIKNIGLEKVGVAVNDKTGKVYVDAKEQTNVRHIYAIGDILDGKLELTPVAIQAGKLLARRLYAKSNLLTDYINVPTTVFTPMEYGCVGYAESDAEDIFGKQNIEVYHSNYWPLEYTLPKRDENVCYAKLICLKLDNMRVIGLHVLGPNAGEITQGFALGVKKGATKADFDDLIGIHPTCAETFTTLQITKASGLSTTAGGC